jgi:hypothetical protein
MFGGGGSPPQDAETQQRRAAAYQSDPNVRDAQQQENYWQSMPKEQALAMLQRMPQLGQASQPGQMTMEQMAAMGGGPSNQQSAYPRLGQASQPGQPTMEQMAAAGGGNPMIFGNEFQTPGLLQIGRQAYHQPPPRIR